MDQNQSLAISNVRTATAHRKLDVLPFAFRNQGLHVFEFGKIAALAWVADLAGAHSDAVRHSFIM